MLYEVITETKDGHISIGLTPLDVLVKAMGTELPAEFADKNTWYVKRDEIMAFLSEILVRNNFV